MQRRIYSLIALMTIGTLSGCNVEGTVLTDPAQVLAVVRMNVRAVTVANITGANTVQLAVTAYRGTDEPIPDVVPVYSVSDNALHVTPQGLVTGVKATTNSYVVGQVSHGGVTHTDTTWISVINTTTPAPLATFRIAMPENVAAGTSERITVTAIDANGVNRSAQIPVAFTTSEARTASVDRYGDLTGITPERTVTVYARTMVHGVSYTDSLLIRISYPLAGQIFVAPRRTATGKLVLEFVPNTIQISAGASVIFCNCLEDVSNIQPIDVVFETPDAVQPSPHPLIPTGPGNIPPFARSEENPLTVMQIRLFPKPGTYRFHSAMYGTTGTLIVR